MGLFRRNKNRGRARSIVSVRPFDLRRDASGRPQSPTRSRRVVVLGVAGVIIYLVILSQMGLRRSWTLWHMRDDLRDRKSKLTAQVVDLDVRKRLLETDTLYIENVARTEYHMSRPDEIIFELETPSDTKAP